MKPRNRDINIFNLSMLDVISGALGAFLIIMIVLFPYYKKESIDYSEVIASLEARIQSLEQQRQAVTAQLQAARAESEETRQQLQAARAESEETRRQLQATRAESEETSRQLGAARRQLAKTFLVIYIRWSTKNQDIDLHVIDPSGAEFYYKKMLIPGRPGELSEDSMIGPGNEVWEIFNAPPGEYRVYAKLYDPHGNTQIPVINGRVIYRDGSRRMNEIRLTSSEKMPMATIVVKEDGEVEIR